MKVLVSPSSFGQCGKESLSILEKKGFQVTINPFGRKLTEKETISLGKDCCGIVAGVEILNKTVLDNLRELKCISRVGVGMDNIDIDFARNRGIAVCNTPNGPTQAVAELTLGLTLALLRKITIADRNIRNDTWKKEIGSLLAGKSIGVLGLGRIGKRVSQLFKSLGNEIYATDISHDEDWIKMHNVTMLGIDQLFQKCDIITVHLPGNQSGNATVGSSLLNKMKKSAFLINVSRGGVIEEDALYRCLKENMISGAAVDVFLNEPYKGMLKTLENTILTPHLGSYAKESKLQMEIDAVNNLLIALEM
jgi:D-3-phosphoglycerate dehydrogenase